MTFYSTRSAGAGWLTDTITRNPEGLLLLAAGCALLMRKAATPRGTEGREFERVYRSEENGYGRVDSVGDEGRSLRETIADTARSASEYASDVSDKIKENASSYASTVSDYADQASQSTGRIARQAGSALESSAQNILQQQPLAVAVAGFAVGAAVAAAFPPTEIERRNLGPTGERLKEAAIKAGEQIKGAGVQAKDKLASVAEEHGLTAEGLKGMAQEVGDAFSQALSEDQNAPSTKRTTQTAVERILYVSTRRISRRQSSQDHGPNQPGPQARPKMTNDVRNLEREVETARSRLKSDLSVLSSARTYAAFKEDLRSEANSTVNNLVEGLKARAAANPAAALAIGAGIAWRVIERPPIAAALIGAGLFSLFRTTPVKSSPFQQRDYFAEGRQRLTEQVSDFAEEIRDEAVDMARSAASHAGNAAGSAAEKMRGFASAATAQVQEQASSASHLASQAINDATELAGELPARAGRTIQKAYLAVDDAISDNDTRDKLLFGAAGLAVATALGIAFQRAMSSSE